jgi:hypothetical protein
MAARPTHENQAFLGFIKLGDGDKTRRFGRDFRKEASAVPTNFGLKENNLTKEKIMFPSMTSKSLAAAAMLVALTITGAYAQCSYVLDGDLPYCFGSAPPNSGDMAAAISQTMGVPISGVSTLANENTAFPPVLGDSNNPPFYVYGPGPTGTIKNLNLNTILVAGIIRGELRYAGTDVGSCCASFDRWVLRVYTQTMFHDVLIKFISCNGICPGGPQGAAWSFFQISGPRPIPGPTLTAAASRKTHGSAGTFDINLPLSGTRGVECRSGAVAGIHSVVFTFSENLTGVDSRVVTPCGTVSSSSIGPNPNQYTVNLTGVCNAQYITVTLTGVHGTAGGTTASASATMGVLLGDVNGDGFVLSGDYTDTRAHSGAPVNGTSFRYDINADGFILSGDYTTVRAQSGMQLPTPP